MAAHWPLLRRAPVVAGAFVAASLGLLIWGLQLRQANTRLEADLRAARHASRPALPPRPAGEAPDGLRTENERLRHQLQEATVPQVNVPTVSLAPGAASAAIADGGTTALLVITPPPTPSWPEYRLRVLAYDGSIVWERAGLKPGPQSAITVVWPGALARPGAYRLELFGPAATDRRVQMYSLTVREAAAG
jgi:hypothetical protein